MFLNVFRHLAVTLFSFKLILWGDSWRMSGPRFEKYLPEAAGQAGLWLRGSVGGGPRVRQYVA